MFYDWVYFSSYLVALILFLAFNFYIHDRLCGESKFIANTVFLSVALVVIVVLDGWHGEKEWEVFRQRNRCQVVDKASGSPLNGEYGKTAYLCSNNFIYWR
ncbi:hypothetical protein [Neisseria wadsworthii]|uniref:hypothetical protein n=1 Tax=Neisseria wadsworthii TaxID=607711 RepID=UPI000D323208|nr:hypothetical protein [Neisseria wadsworthii]